MRVLFSNELSEAEKRAILENEYGIAMTRRKAVTELCNLSEGILEKGIIRGKAEGYTAGKADGVVEGKAEGYATGKTEGIVNGIKNLMKNMNISMIQAMDLLGIPKTERQVYQALLHNSDIDNLN